MLRLPIRLLATAVAALTAFSLRAQTEIEPSLQIDMVSHYMWRGTDMAGVSIQPAGKLSWQGFSVQLGSSMGLTSDELQKLDLTVGYSAYGFNIGVTDYWSTGIDYAGLNRYFYYDPRRSAHQYEGNIGYSCPYFSLQAYTMFWGNDYKYETEKDYKQRANGKRAYSTYLELRVPVYLMGLDWDFSAGVTPFESAGYTTKEMVDFGQGEERANVRKYFYAGGPACIMLSARATKNFTLGDIKVPAFAEIHTNPYTQKAQFLVGVSVIPF